MQLISCTYCAAGHFKSLVMCYDAYSFNLEITSTCWSGTPFDYVIRVTVFVLLLDLLVCRSKNIAKLIESMQFRSKI